MIPSKSYHIAEAGKQSGPFSPEDIRDQIANGQWTPAALVWCEGMPDWRPLEAVFPPPAATPPPLSANPPPLPPGLNHSRQRKNTGCIWATSAGVVAVLLFGLLIYSQLKLIEKVKERTTAGESDRPLFVERADHETRWQDCSFEASGEPEPPPTDIFTLVRYPSPAGELAAYLTPDPKDGQKHPAMVWAKGGFGGIGSFLWEPASKRNDQSARAFREKGIVLMCPSWRGENDNPGRFELFGGEVEDLIAAIEHVKSLPYVDPERVYIGGHSTGGTLTLLASVASDSFRAAFAFGGMPDGVEILNKDGGYGNTPYDDRSIQDHRLRSAIRYTRFIRKPTYYFEGEHSAYNGAAARMEVLAKKHGVPFQAFELPGDHFDILHPITHHVADLILADEGPAFDSPISLPDLEAAYHRAFAGALEHSLSTWSPDGEPSLEEFLNAMDPDDAMPHTIADVDAVETLAGKLATQPMSPRTLADMTTLTDLQFEIDDIDVWDAFSSQVIPPIIGWARAQMPKAGALPEDDAKLFVGLIESVLQSDAPEAMACGVLTVQSELQVPSHTWSSLMSVYDEEHPDTQDWFDSLANPLPKNPDIAIALLESANDVLLGGWEGSHPFDSPDGMTLLRAWIEDRNPEVELRAHPAALALAFLKSDSKGIQTLLQLALKHPMVSVRMEAAWSDVHHGGTDGLKMLQEACLDVHLSRRAQSYLGELDKSDAIPKKAQEPSFAATAEMSGWLQHPNELGDQPITLEVYDQRRLFWPPNDEELDVWLFKFTYRFDDDTEDQTGYGMVGGMTWSSFIDYESPPSPEALYLHHCALELNRHTLSEDSAKSGENLRSALEALQKGNPGVFDAIDPDAP